MKTEPFTKIKGRYIVILWLFPLLFLPGIEAIYGLLDSDTMWYWFDLVSFYYYHLIVTFFLVCLVVYGKLNWRMMYGRFEHSDFIPAVKLTLFIFIFSLAAAYALFYPLSYTHPDFVQWWYIDTPEIIYFTDQGFPLMANMLSVASLVIIAPVLEEFTFRGLLLHRWHKKWGMTKAILVSSLLFGIAHPDPAGAMAFGIAMSILYLKSRTLWLPTLCHALNNLVVCIIEAYYVNSIDPGDRYTLEDFQNEWYVGVISAVIVLTWSYLYLNGPKSQRSWRLPDI